MPSKAAVPRRHLFGWSLAQCAGLALLATIGLIYHDTISVPDMQIWGPQAVHYRSPLASRFECPDEFEWTITVPGAR